MIDLDAIVGFLSKHEKSVDNDIFKDYVSYSSNLHKYRKKKIETALDFYENKEGKEYNEIFCSNYAQWEVMLSLKNKVKDVFPQQKNYLLRDNNIGGDPWTQFYWYEIKGKYKNTGITEHIFWRLDGWYQLRLRHGVWPDDEEYDGFNENRKNRLYLLRDIFKEEAEEIFGITCNYPRGRSGRESAIGEISFDSPENSVQKIISKMPDFHKRFIERI